MTWIIPSPSVHIALLALLAMVSLLTGCASTKPAAPRIIGGVAIEGTPEFTRQVENAFKLLDAKSPLGYSILTNQVGIVRRAEHSGMKAPKKPPVFELNDRSAFYSLTWCAGVLAHDSFHSKLYHDYKREHWLLVPRKVWTGPDAERKCLDHQLRVLAEIGAPEREIKHCRETTFDFVDVPYRKRNW